MKTIYVYICVWIYTYNVHIVNMLILPIYIYLLHYIANIYIYYFPK